MAPSNMADRFRLPTRKSVPPCFVFDFGDGLPWLNYAGEVWGMVQRRYAPSAEHYREPHGDEPVGRERRAALRQSADTFCTGGG